MPTIRNTVTISATPDDVWAVLADMPGTRHWLPGVVSARMDGSLRVCTMADGQEVHERISDVSEGKRSFRFDHEQVPLPVRNSGGTFTVNPGETPATATVILETTFEPIDAASADQLTARVHGAFQQSLDSLRTYVEEKVPWDAR
jgi:uncharacterized protein YndB with AHSA1/START domain